MGAGVHGIPATLEIHVAQVDSRIVDGFILLFFLGGRAGIHIVVVGLESDILEPPILRLVQVVLAIYEVHFLRVFKVMLSPTKANPTLGNVLDWSLELEGRVEEWLTTFLVLSELAASTWHRRARLKFIKGFTINYKS